MGAVASLIATALVLTAPSAQTGERAVALLSDNRLIQLALHGPRRAARERNRHSASQDRRPSPYAGILFGRARRGCHRLIDTVRPVQ
jgi:hypothetical protein